MNSAPTQGLELYKKEQLRFQRTNQMLHKSNARVYRLKNCGNQTLWVESAPVAQCLIGEEENTETKEIRTKNL